MERERREQAKQQQKQQMQMLRLSQSDNEPPPQPLFGAPKRVSFDFNLHESILDNLTLGVTVMRMVEGHGPSSRNCFASRLPGAIAGDWRKSP